MEDNYFARLFKTQNPVIEVKFDLVEDLNVLKVSEILLCRIHRLWGLASPKPKMMVPLKTQAATSFLALRGNQIRDEGAAYKKIAYLPARRMLTCYIIFGFGLQRRKCSAEKVTATRAQLA